VDRADYSVGVIKMNVRAWFSLRPIRRQSFDSRAVAAQSCESNRIPCGNRAFRAFGNSKMQMQTIVAGVRIAFPAAFI
jgi:hypothetical protein